MVERLERLVNRLCADVDSITQALVLVLTVVVLVQVVSRFLHVPIKWTVEVSRLLFTWLGFLGLVAAIFTDSVPRFTVLIDRVGGRIYVVLKFATDVLVLVFLAALFFSTFRVVRIAHAQDMALLPFKWSYAYVSLPVTLLLLICVYLLRLGRQYAQARSYETRGTDEDYR